MYLKYMMYVYESVIMKFNVMYNECMIIVGRKRKGRKKWDGGGREGRVKGKSKREEEDDKDKGEEGRGEERVRTVMFVYI